MIKKPLFIFALTACATSSFAFSPFNTLGATHKKSHHTAIHKKAVNESTNYTDFSGTWIGTCSDSDGDAHDMETITIKNDAMEISFDNELYSIGGLKTDSKSHSWSTSFDHEALFWNTEKNQLIFNGVFVGKSHLTNNTYDAPQIFTNLANMNLSIEDEDLMVRGSIITFSGIKQEQTQDILCTYKREMH